MYPIRFSKENLIITVLAGIVLFTLASLWMPCIFLTLFDIPCPGCGMTRAFLSLLSLRFQDALHYNSSIFLMPLFYLYFWQNGAVFYNKVINRLVIILSTVLFLLRYLLHIFYF